MERKEMKTIKFKDDINYGGRHFNKGDIVKIDGLSARILFELGKVVFVDNKEVNKAKSKSKKSSKKGLFKKRK